MPVSYTHLQAHGGGISHPDLALIPHLAVFRPGRGRSGQLQGQYAAGLVGPLLVAQAQQPPTGKKVALRRVKNRIALKVGAKAARAVLTQAFAQIVQINIREFTFHFQRHGYSSGLWRR